MCPQTGCAEEKQIPESLWEQRQRDHWRSVSGHRITKTNQKQLDGRSPTMRAAENVLIFLSFWFNVLEYLLLCFLWTWFLNKNLFHFYSLELFHCWQLSTCKLFLSSSGCNEQENQDCVTTSVVRRISTAHVAAGVTTIVLRGCWVNLICFLQGELVWGRWIIWNGLI